MKPVLESKQGSQVLQAERKELLNMEAAGDFLAYLRGPQICKQDAYSLQGSRSQYEGEHDGSARKLRIQPRKEKFCYIWLRSWGFCWDPE